MAKPPRDNEGRFLPGHTYSKSTQIKRRQRLSPQTEIQPGQRLSPETEFRPGQPAHNKLPVGSVRVRTDPQGRPRAWIKTGEPNIWKPRAIVVWEDVNDQRLPRGFVVHHKDRDTLNDDPSNLAALTRRDHLEEHRNDWCEGSLDPRPGFSRGCLGSTSQYGRGSASG